MDSTQIFVSFLQGTLTLAQAEAALRSLGWSENAITLNLGGIQDWTPARKAAFIAANSGGGGDETTGSGTGGGETTGSGGGGGETTDSGTTPFEDVGNFGPVYQKALAAKGLNAGIGGGTFGDWLQSRQGPAFNVWRAGALQGANPGEQAGNEFANYIRQNIGNLGNLAGQARQSYQGMLDTLTSGQVNPWLEAFTNPVTPQDFGLGTGLAEEISRGRFGGYLTNRFMPDAERLRTQFQVGSTGGQSEGFLPWLKKYLGF